MHAHCSPQLSCTRIFVHSGSWRGVLSHDVFGTSAGCPFYKGVSEHARRSDPGNPTRWNCADENPSQLLLFKSSVNILDVILALYDNYNTITI